MCERQVLVLIHKGADIAAYSPIHLWRFRPAPVVAAFSRTAGLAPMIQGKEAIWHWFMAPRPVVCRPHMCMDRTCLLVCAIDNA